MLQDLLIRQKDNDRIALKQGETSISYKDWYKESLALSNEISKTSSINSYNIGIFLPNSIKYAIAYFGILFDEKTIVPIGVKEKTMDVQSVIEYCEIDVIITDDVHIEKLKHMLNGYKYQLSLINIDRKTTEIVNGDKQEIEKSDNQLVGDEDERVAIMLHTSGTLSNPKRVMLTHSNLLSNIQSNILSLNLDDKDVTLILLPMHFGYCNTAQFLTHVYIAAKIVIMDKIFMPKAFFEIVQHEGITNFTAVPTILILLLKYRYSSRYDISKLRYVCFGGGVINKNIIKKIVRKFPSVGFVHTYGQTECSPRVTALLPEFSYSKAGSVGRPIPNVEVKVVDENDKEVEVGVVGQIVVKGSNVMKGYYKREELTSQTIRDGWLFTGDMGYFDEEGFLYIKGRIKNVIISGGINIYPEDIEEFLCSYSDVKDALVFGVSDSVLGEVPVAKIVVNNTIDVNDLRRFCVENLTSYKIPKEFIICEVLEKTYNGKKKRR